MFIKMHVSMMVRTPSTARHHKCGKVQILPRRSREASLGPKSCRQCGQLYTYLPLPTKPHLICGCLAVLVAKLLASHRPVDTNYRHHPCKYSPSSKNDDDFQLFPVRGGQWHSRTQPHFPSWRMGCGIAEDLCSVCWHLPHHQRLVDIWFCHAIHHGFVSIRSSHPRPLLQHVNLPRLLPPSPQVSRSGPS